MQPHGIRFLSSACKAVMALLAWNLAACAMSQSMPAQGTPASSAQRDTVPPRPVPRLAPQMDLPVSARLRLDDMPAYNAAQPQAGGQALDLEQVYLLALQNDPKLHGAYQELQAMGFGVGAARAGLLPHLTGEINRSRIGQNVVQSENQYYQGGRASWGENGWTLTLVQPLLDLGAYRKWQQSQEAERKEVASYAYAQQDLMLRVAKAYLSILAAQDQVALTEAEHRMTQQQMELVQARYQGGLVTQVGVSEVQARLDIQHSNTLLARNDALDKQQALQEIIGHSMVALRPVRKDLPLELPAPNDVQRWLATALEQNWSIRAAAASVAVAEKAVAVEAAGHYPSLALRASTGRNATGGSLFGGGSTVGDNRIMLTLSLPFYQGGYTSHMGQAAASRLQASLSELSLARRQVQRQVLSTFQGIVIGVERIKALERSVQSFELALTLKRQGFAAGINDVVSVLDATRNLYNAKRQQAEAGYNFVLDGLQLKQAAGTLNAADIAAASQLML